MAHSKHFTYHKCIHMTFIQSLLDSKLRNPNDVEPRNVLPLSRTNSIFSKFRRYVDFAHAKIFQ